MTKPPPRILSIAGSDSSGGAGIQADIKTITMLGGYAMTAITAVTAQNTLGVQGVETLSGEMVLEQIASCVDDISIDAIKIGMLGSEDIVRHVAGGLVAAPEIAARTAAGHARKNAPPGLPRFPIVLDPVMIASSGAHLCDEATVAAMTKRLFPLAVLITPNLPELAALTGMPLGSIDEIGEAAHTLAARHGTSVLAKGGHGEGARVVDILVAPGGEAMIFDDARLPGGHTHGTGCTLSSAIATLLGHGQALPHAVRLARQFVRAAIEHAPGFGIGNGPLGHQAVRSLS